jgi:hypothetical protein
MADAGRGGPYLRLLPLTGGAGAVGGRAGSERPTIAHPFEYSSVQINLPPAIAEAIVEFAARVPDCDLAEAGRTTEPHVTIKQRLILSQPRQLISLLADEQTFSVTFGRTHVFTTPDHDIVHVDVAGKRLHDLHDAVSTLQHGDPLRAYHPHVTIAFVKPSCGAKYGGDGFLAGLVMPVRALSYSGADGTALDIPLRWSAQA